MPKSLQPHGLQHARPPYTSRTPRVYSNSCPLSWWCHPTFSFCHLFILPPSIFPSIRVFSSESALHIRWPKYWSFSFSISPSNEQPGLISFRMDWLDLLAVQGTFKSFLQHHSSKASILWHSAFFMVQLSHPYITNYWCPSKPGLAAFLAERSLSHSFFIAELGTTAGSEAVMRKYWYVSL